MPFTPPEPTTYGSSPYGKVIEVDNMIVLLTPCCDASGKGAGYSYSGVVCRACYVDVDTAYGDCAMANDPADVARFVAHYDVTPVAK